MGDLNWYELELLTREHLQELRRQAARERLVRQARPRQTGRMLFLLRALGRLLLRAGRALRARPGRGLAGQQSEAAFQKRG